MLSETELDLCAVLAASLVVNPSGYESSIGLIRSIRAYPSMQTLADNLSAAFEECRDNEQVGLSTIAAVVEKLNTAPTVEINVAMARALKFQIARFDAK
jgi:hypothetical protein